MRALAGCAVLCAVVTLWPSRAEAELPRPYGETTGWFVEGMFSGNGLTNDDYIDPPGFNDIDIDPLVGLSANIGYRLLDWVSIGLLIHYGFLAADYGDVDQDTAGFLGVLLEVQGHLPMSRFDPWIGFGFGYAMTFSHLWGDYYNVDYNYRISLHGIGIGVSAGLNIFITQQLAIGPFFRFIFGVYPTACYDIDIEIPDVHDEDCDDLDDIYNDLDDKPHLWTVGLNLSYVFD